MSLLLLGSTDCPLGSSRHSPTCSRVWVDDRPRMCSRALSRRCTRQIFDRGISISSTELLASRMPTSLQRSNQCWPWRSAHRISLPMGSVSSRERQLLEIPSDIQTRTIRRIDTSGLIRGWFEPGIDLKRYRAGVCRVTNAATTISTGLVATTSPLGRPLMDTVTADGTGTRRVSSATSRRLRRVRVRLQAKRPSRVTSGGLRAQPSRSELHEGCRGSGSITRVCEPSSLVVPSLCTAEDEQS